MDIIHLFIGALILAMIHGVMPDHWIPLVMVSEVEKWGKGETLGAAVLVVVPHTIVTISIGTAVGLIGYHLSSDFEHETMIIASLILFVMGLIYISKEYKSEQPHGSTVKTESKARRKTKIAIITSLAAVLFFSPCLSTVSYYFVAGTFGWPGISLVSVVYLTVTVLSVVSMVYLGLKGVEKTKGVFLERHGKSLTGIVLIVFGVLILLHLL